MDALHQKCLALCSHLVPTLITILGPCGFRSLINQPLCAEFLNASDHCRNTYFQRRISTTSWLKANAALGWRRASRTSPIFLAQSDHDAGSRPGHGVGCDRRRRVVDW